MKINPSFSHPKKNQERDGITQTAAREEGGVHCRMTLYVPTIFLTDVKSLTYCIVMKLDV